VAALVSWLRRWDELSALQRQAGLGEVIVYL
jgi:hypothetical protein